MMSLNSYFKEVLFLILKIRTLIYTWLKFINSRIIREKKKKNIETVLLLDPKNEEANYLLIEIELKKSNYLKVKDLTENFSKICNKLCDKKTLILEALEDLEPKNES